jgi:hypothetical protein
MESHDAPLYDAALETGAESRLDFGAAMRWNFLDKDAEIELTRGGLRAHRVHDAMETADSGAGDAGGARVRADAPAPSGAALFYFEVEY